MIQIEIVVRHGGDTFKITVDKDVPVVRNAAGLNILPDAPPQKLALAWQKAADQVNFWIDSQNER